MQEDLDFFFGPAPTKAAANPAAGTPSKATPTQGGGGDDFFGMFGQPTSQQQQAPKTPQQQPQQQQQQASAFDNDDFFDMLGSANTTNKKPSASPSSPSQKPPTEQMSKASISSSSSSTKPATAAKKPVQQESESESESEEEAKEVVKQQKSGIDSDDEEKPKSSNTKRPCASADCSLPALATGKYCASHSAGGGSKEDTRKTKGEWSIERKRTGTKLGFIKNITIWKFYFKGEQHTVELYHSTFSGKRVIIVDKKQLVSEKKLIGGDASHKVFAGADFNTRCEVTVVIKSNNDRYEYAIYIEGLPIRDAKKKYAEYI